VLDKDEETGLGYVAEAGDFQSLTSRPASKLREMLEEAGVDVRIQQSAVMNVKVQVPELLGQKECVLWLKCLHITLILTITL